MSGTRTLLFVAATLAALLSIASAPGYAATAHNSQRGGLGDSANNAGSTLASPHVRHHRHHRHR